MKIKTLKNQALSVCLVVAIFATYSMVALAGENNVVGEVLVSGKSVDGNAPVVLVNGEAAQSGRTIFTTSTITTPKNATAIVNINKVGKIKIAPNSTVAVSFDNEGISGNLSNGQVTVLNSNNAVNMTVPGGAIEKVNAGETVSTAKQDDDDDDDAGSAWVLWALVFGGAAAAIIFAATTDNNRVDLGGGATTISPNV